MYCGTWKANSLINRSGMCVYMWVQYSQRIEWVMYDVQCMCW